MCIGFRTLTSYIGVYTATSCVHCEMSWNLTLDSDTGLIPDRVTGLL